MKAAKIIFFKLLFFFLLLLLLNGLVLVSYFLSYPYKELSASLRDADPGMVEFNIVFYFFLTLILVALALWMKKKSILFKKPKKFIILIGTLWILTLLSPFYYGYFVNVDKIVIRADYRIQQDKWEQAINIYKEIERYMDFPNEQILKIQKKLNEIGYYNYEVNGKPDDRIIKQLKKLQNDYGLGTVGFFGPKSKTVVYGIRYNKILGIDIENKSFKDIELAVLKFQINNKIEPTGIINENTLELLKNTSD